MDMLLMMLQSFYLILPAAFANMSPVLFKNVGFLDYPVDFNIKIKGKRMLGRNKTWRGVFFGVVVAIIVVLIQEILYKNNILVGISLLDYSIHSFILVGFLLGIGAAFGDIAESFIKRIAGIVPGGKLLFFDQVDWVLGGFLFVSFIYTPSIMLVLVSLLVFFVLHVIVKHTGYFLKLEDKKW